jgi:transposase-like protein
LTQQKKRQELNVIKYIANKNKYDSTMVDALQNLISNNKKDRQKIDKEEDNQKTKWATLSYVGKESNKITRLFRNTDVKISFTTNNTMQKLLTHKLTEKSKDQYNKIGIYQLTCPDCEKKYVGQTGRPFCTRFSEHLRDYKYQTPKSKFALHLLENNHSMAPMDQIMKILYNTNKGNLMNTIEQFHIYKITQENIQINDKNTVKPNVIFKTIV